MRKNKGLYKRIHSDNSGSALIVSIIVLLFVSILATIILYISGINYRMKKSEFNTKVAFYDSEAPLEAIEANIVLPYSEALNEGFRMTNTRYVVLATADARREDFYQNVYDSLQAILLDNYGHSTIGDGIVVSDNVLPIKYIVKNLTYSNVAFDDGIIIDDSDHSNDRVICNTSGVDVLHDPGSGADIPAYNYVRSLFDEKISGTDDYKYFNEDGVYIVIPDNLCHGTPEENYQEFVQLATTDTSGMLLSPDKCRIVFKNVCVVSVRGDYRSIITTDIALQFPPLDWEGGSGTTGYEAWDVYQLIYYVNWQKY
ncbi:MAG: hypothetical protein K5871_02030 [Lachnospiraceae bacterium]|nr:hypothetical protein [Lachnospiraceae bacterium]